MLKAFLQSASPQKYIIPSAGFFAGGWSEEGRELEAAGLGVGAGGAVVCAVPANTLSVTWERQGGAIKR